MLLSICIEFFAFTVNFISSTKHNFEISQVADTYTWSDHNWSDYN